ncbi:MAG: hypothetical protein ACI9QD_000765, partial [Thermoproteota archaeon]
LSSKSKTKNQINGMRKRPPREIKTTLVLFIIRIVLLKAARYKAGIKKK